jgi:Na+-translocating ferredoxin:NAD+ oxidoreductase RnfD subunit
LIVHLFPISAVSVPGQWAGSAWMILLVAIVGTFVIVRAGSHWVSVSYLGSFAIFSTLRGLMQGISPLFLAGPAIGVPGLIFTFHMISDPRTIPLKLKNQIAFGILVALVDVLFRYYTILYPQFISLMLITALFVLWDKKR